MAVEEDGAQVFGNTLPSLKKALLAGAVVCGAVLLLFIATAVFRGGWAAFPVAFKWPVVAIPPAVGAILPLVVLPTTLFSIQVTDRAVRHLFLGRKVLGEGSLEDLESIDLGRGFFAVVLHFRDGSRIRFAGAHVAECARLCDHLVRRSPRPPLVRRGSGPTTRGLTAREGTHREDGMRAQGVWPSAGVWFAGVLCAAWLFSCSGEETLAGTFAVQCVSWR
jgi:hypothetical protein